MSALYRSPERRDGYSHFIRVWCCEKSQPEDLKTPDGGHSFEFLVYCADEDLPPKPVDYALGLPLLLQPLQHLMSADRDVSYTPSASSAGLG